ncbi:von Willebrand factor A domain-containing protein 7 [Larimichthys crocea]|uniref:von Willebrand factor A domain-containing protein 7 n=1 Tax=Larimichthys crocea TaxID=215358 RepID=UPI000F5F7557|nr:von Willebrand factor A domain-containing protein 7 [Larimichthys crocea]XP_027136157.1 von Willebrand factor A domain-containing protein 7 [Larimichthys crocea]XP_027136158.1 von Willebrand factor A domain-containing protein 7 [Larimichthys crocea]
MMSQDRGRIWQGSGKHKHRLILAYLLLLASPCMGFLPNFWSRVLTLSWGSRTHQCITEQSILNVTLETLRGTNKHHRNHAREQTRLGRCFWRAVGEVVKSNVAMDFLSSTRSNPIYHFDSERIDSSMVMLRQFWVQTLLSIRAKEYQSARHSLGQLFHSLQDFYSHSNWVEMGQRFIYLHLLHPEEPAIPVAKEDTPTCMECFSITCRDNLLPRLTNTQQDSTLLTTGYFSTFPPKPQGKCSHGGILDSSRYMGAKGGINKDSTSPLFSPHHYLHVEAATLATEATLSVLRDLRDTVGHKTFLRLFSVKQAPALVFVMDTTGSMFEEISAARFRAHSIIQSRANSPGQPGTFLLVPFHDPEVGPVQETDDPNQFMQFLENLMALGGGDEPEMCLSAVQLALTHSPPLSEIFVFTDASPKDIHLFDAVKALALEKQSKVTFLLTEDPNYTTKNKWGRRKRRRETLSPDRFSLYSSLSSLSGGLTIFTTNSDILDVSSIVEDNTATDKVTLLHVESDQELMSSHSFRVDSSVKNVTLHVTGILIECIITSPSDLSQSLLSQQGPLAELKSFKGLYRISLLSPIQPGQWKLQAKSDGHLTFNVIGDSSVDFLYYFATVTNETHPGLARMEGSPVAGVPAFLVLAVTGLPPDEEASFSHVTLLGADGESLQWVKLNSSSSSSYSMEELVGWVDSIPRVPFCVRLTGQDSRGNKLERVSTEMVQPTHIQIQVLSVPRLVPGHSTTVDFEILNYGPARLLSLTADDDCGYLQNRSPYRFHVAEQGSFRGQVDLYTPVTAQEGVTVTLTLTVRALDSPDSNYAVAYLTVVPPESDTSPPSCSAALVQSTCRSICNESHWSVSLVVTDRGRSGLATLQLQEGEGILTLFHSPPPTEDSLVEPQPDPEWQQAHRDQTTSGGHHLHENARLEKGDPPLNVSEWVLDTSQPLWVRYASSCCSAQAELLVWDKAGNMKRCQLTSGKQRQLQDRSTETSDVGRIKLTDVFFLVLCLLWSSLL